MERIAIIIFLACLLIAANIPKHYEAYIQEHLFTFQLLESSTGVPTSVQIAQAIIESGGGRSNIAQSANNHFGIRCGDNWEGERYYSKSGCWRKYPTAKKGFLDHACFLNDHYNSAVGKSWQYWCDNLEGYGGPGYWKEVKKVILRYKLYKYDL